MAVLVASPAVWLPRDGAARCEPLRFTGRAHPIDPYKADHR